MGQDVALADEETGELMAVLTVEEKYEIDKRHECQEVFRTLDPAHPGVAAVTRQGDVNLAGPVAVLSEGAYPERYPGLYMRPEDTRRLFAEKGWKTVAALQLRNPMHRSHEALAKIAVEVSDGVLIQQILGKLKPGDIPAEVRVKAVDALVERYFVRDTCVQAGVPLEMRYAGPREALLHAVFRQNFGCSHLIVGRDHAGVGDFYGPFDSQKIFDELPEGALEIMPLKIDWTFYCGRCDGMASLKTCPHEPERPGERQRHHAQKDAVRGRPGARPLQPARGAGHPAGLLREPRRQGRGQAAQVRHGRALRGASRERANANVCESGQV